MSCKTTLTNIGVCEIPYFIPLKTVGSFKPAFLLSQAYSKLSMWKYTFDAACAFTLQHGFFAQRLKKICKTLLGQTFDLIC